MGAGPENLTTFITEGYSTQRDNEILQLTPNTTVNVTAVPGKKNWAALAVLPIVAFVAMGNVLVILAVKLDIKLRSSTNYFLTSLAVADLLVAITVMPPSLAMIINKYEWPFPESLCGIWVMLDVCFSTASILHLCMISLDRYLALAKPFRYSNGGWLSKNSSSSGGWATNKRGNSKWRMGSGLGGGSSKLTKRVAKRIVIVWAISLGIALPLPIMGHKDRNNIFIEQMCVINIPEFTIYGSLVAFFLPLVVMFITYSLTIRTLQKQARLVKCIMGKDGSSTHRGRPSMTSSMTSRQSFKASQGSGGSTRSVIGKRMSSGVSDGNSLPDLLDSTRNGHKRTESSVSDISFKSGYSESRIKTCAIICCACFHLKRSESPELESEFMQSEFDEKSKTTLHKSDSDSSESSSTTNQPTGMGRSPMLTRANMTISKVVSKLPLNRLSTRRISASVKSRAIATEQRASKVLGMIFTLFCIFWCPFFITNFFSGLCERYGLQCNLPLMGNLMNWFVWVGYVSSGVNPCVYTLFSRQFRETFRKIICGQCSEVGQRGFHRQFRRDGTAFSASSFHQDSAFSTDHRDAFRSDIPTKSTTSTRVISERQRTLGESVIIRQHKRNQITRSVDTMALLNKKGDVSPNGEDDLHEPLQWRSTWHYMIENEEGGIAGGASSNNSARKDSAILFRNGYVGYKSRRTRRLFSDPDTSMRRNLMAQNSIPEDDGDDEDSEDAEFVGTDRRYNSRVNSRRIEFKKARFHCGSESSGEESENNNIKDDVFEASTRGNKKRRFSTPTARGVHVTRVRFSSELQCRDCDVKSVNNNNIPSVSSMDQDVFSNEGDSQCDNLLPQRTNSRTVPINGFCRQQELPRLDSGVGDSVRNSDSF